jgi:hypothetical protein
VALPLERVAELGTGRRWGEIRRELGRLKMVAYSGGDRREIVEPDHFPSTRPVMGVNFVQYLSPRLA